MELPGEDNFNHFCDEIADSVYRPRIASVLSEAIYIAYRAASPELRKQMINYARPFDLLPQEVDRNFLDVFVLNSWKSILMGFPERNPDEQTNIIDALRGFIPSVEAKWFLILEMIRDLPSE